MTHTFTNGKKEGQLIAYQKYQWFQKTILKMFAGGGTAGGRYPGMYM
jgi:hypothetical protein